MTLSDKLYKILIKGGSWKTILGGLWVTVRISFFALLMGTVLGALVMLEKPDAGQIVIDGQEITDPRFDIGAPVLSLLPLRGH